jgi:hypothetical protein
VNRQNACVETVPSTEAQAHLKQPSAAAEVCCSIEQNVPDRDRNMRDRAIKFINKQKLLSQQSSVPRHFVIMP